MSDRNTSIDAAQCETSVEPVTLNCEFVVCQLAGADFLTTPESCRALGGTILLEEHISIKLVPDELIICQLSGEDFVTTPESCLAMGGTIVGQPTGPGSQATPRPDN